MTARPAQLAAETFRDRIERLEEAAALAARRALVPRQARPGGARLRAPHPVPARPRPDRALQGLPPAQAQDPGVHRAGGRPLPHPADPHARGLRHRPQRRAGAGAERGPDRGDLARARPRPPAVRPHRRGRARPLRPGALRRALPPQPPLAADRGEARVAQPDRAGARRDPPPHRLRACGHARGPHREGGRPDRLHQPRHRRRPSRRGAAGRGPARERDPPARRARTSERIETLVQRPRGPLARGGRRGAGRGGRRRDAEAAQVHVRARLPGARRTAREAPDRADADRALLALCGTSRPPRWCPTRPSPSGWWTISPA